MHTDKTKSTVRSEYTVEEREEMIAKMNVAIANFYSAAVQTNVHAFIEFTGLMSEFSKVCQEANKQGIAFEFSNTHSGKPLPFEPWNAQYLAEKLNCIYGASLLDDEGLRDAFIATLFEGRFQLKKVDHTDNSR